MKLGSYDSIWYTDYNGITFVMISQIHVLMEYGDKISDIYTDGMRQFIFFTTETLHRLHLSLPPILIDMCIIIFANEIENKQQFSMNQKFILDSTM